MDSFLGISIIICTHNGSSRLHPTLEAITNLKADFPWEIILVNNASSDNTDFMVNEFFSTQKKVLHWKIIEESSPGLIHARFKGISFAKYGYVLFCDDDNWLFPDYLTNVADILSLNPKIGVLGGKGIPVFEGEKPVWFDQYSSSFAVGSQSWHIGIVKKELGYLYGAGVVFKKEILDEIVDSKFELVLTGRKGDTLISGDDVELCYLAQLLGYELHYSDRLEFYHWMADNRMNWTYYLKLKEGITRGAGFLFSYHYFYKNRNSGVLVFGLALSRKLLSSIAVYIKNLLSPSESIVHRDLSIRVLKANQLSFRKDFFQILSHFKKLKAHF